MNWCNSMFLAENSHANEKHLRFSETLQEFMFLASNLFLAKYLGKC